MTLRKFGKALLWTLIIGGIVAAVLHFFVFRVWKIPTDDPVMSASLTPTLRGGDVVLLLHMAPVGFSDLVRCVDPDEPRRWVVGRIVAEGGDTLIIGPSRLTINGKVAPLEHACAPPTFRTEDPSTGSEVELRCNMEDLGGTVHMRAYGMTQSIKAPIKRKVQPGHVFLVSDNRFYPNDSRTYGPLPLESCDSRIVFRLVGEEGFADSESRLTYIH